VPSIDFFVSLYPRTMEGLSMAVGEGFDPRPAKDFIPQNPLFSL
jgi:hypothetical protein